MAASSGSDEGEIIESDSEKATTSLHSARGTTVDRHSRNHSPASKSIGEPLPSIAPRDPSSPKDYPRGEKRSRDNDAHRDSSRADPRRFRVHYEGRSYENRDRRRFPYRDLDGEEASGEGLRYDDRGGRRGYADKRARTRSRSPPQYSRSRENGGRYGTRHRDEERDTYSRNRRDQPTTEEYGKGHNGEIPKGRRDDRIGPNERARLDDRKQSGSSGQNSRQEGRTESSQRPTAATILAKSNADSPEVAADAQPVDEATLIEARRKRREAIKAKYQGQATPLLVQALQGGHISDPPSPSGLRLDDSDPSSTRPTTPKASPPQSPREVSGVTSPTGFSVVKDEELANSGPTIDNATDHEEPSAADYDPTMDMREDKLRDDQRHHLDEVSSGAYDETKANAQAVLLPPQAEAQAEPKAKKKKDEFDMFADEDEEDDMFAEQPGKSNTHVGGDQMSKAVPVPQSKQLDMSMLDDWDDHEGYYRVILGELLDGRYHVQTNLGKGMFSGVVRALDNKTRKLVAIKLIRNNDTMKRAGMKEIEILELLAQADPEDKKHMIRLERFFEHKGHLCMVFENLSINLREVLKKFGRDVGINLRAVRAYAQQMFLGLSLLRKCNILHADLKPDNVLVNESRSMLKICDLGSASDASENEITPYLVSRFYRAPEIILGMPYDFAIDTWSVGCTLYELYTGKILFTGRTNNQMLRAVMECRGKFSQKMLRRCEFAGLHFDDMLNFRSVEKDRLTGKDVVRTLNIVKPIRDLKSRLMPTSKGVTDAELKELNLFADLLDRCLNLNPEKRCTPAEALKHPFINRPKP
ncbi:MAG: U4/U6 small nuclear ribonucleoprotein prp4 [Piccolia ochrophora]|nr:MAG: U4/U6 small nuclear ribonucleoprotein prp4 [Piccolia ochrophora]